MAPSTSVTGTGTSSSFIAGTAGMFSLLVSAIMIAPLVYGHQSPGSGYGRVEERRNDGRKLGRRVDVVMCRGGQNGEPGIAHSGPIPTGIDLASAKQFEERHGMRGADAVGISHHNQGGRLDRSHLIGPVIVLPEQLAELGEQHWPLFRLRRDAGIMLVHRGLLHRLRDLRTHLPHSREYLWVPSIPLEGGRD